MRYLLAILCLVIAGAGWPVQAQSRGADGAEVLTTWHRLVLELVRHTPTYSPPVASRAFGYVGVTAWEVVAGLSGGRSLSGQLNGLDMPPPAAPADIDPALAMHGAMAASVQHFFGNTGPTGQRAMQAMTDKTAARLAADLPPEAAARSLAHGAAVAAHIIEWSQGDGGALVQNMGFPMEYLPKSGPEFWVPTSTIVQQQAPLLPAWGQNRPFAMPMGNACPLPPPPAYSEEAGSAFRTEAQEVYDTSRSLTDEQKLIARFWSDDPMLSPTPPGHWVSILLDEMERADWPADRRADALARLGIGIADAFIGCWHTKFEYDLVRPVTYIWRVIDPGWQPLLITPPFPEYPSGHSTQSGAAAGILTALFGENHSFDDATHAADGLPVRHFTSFGAAAEEAAISRLYGGIHFRAAIDRGLAQGACIATHANRLETLE